MPWYRVRVHVNYHTDLEVPALDEDDAMSKAEMLAEDVARLELGDDGAGIAALADDAEAVEGPWDDNDN